MIGISFGKNAREVASGKPEILKELPQGPAVVVERLSARVTLRRLPKTVPYGVEKTYYVDGKKYRQTGDLDWHPVMDQGEMHLRRWNITTFNDDGSKDILLVQPKRRPTHFSDYYPFIDLEHEFPDGDWRSMHRAAVNARTDVELKEIERVTFPKMEQISAAWESVATQVQQGQIPLYEKAGKKFRRITYEASQAGFGKETMFEQLNTFAPLAARRRAASTPLLNNNIA